jgi:hypothetical protein
MPETQFSRDLKAEQEKTTDTQNTREQNEANQKGLESLMEAIGIQAKYNAIKEQFDSGNFENASLRAGDFINIQDITESAKGDPIRQETLKPIDDVLKDSNNLSTKEKFLELLADLSDLSMDKKIFADRPVYNDDGKRVGKKKKHVMTSKPPLHLQYGVEQVAKAIVEGFYNFGEQHKSKE